MTVHIVENGAEFSLAINTASPGDTIRVLPRADGEPLSANLYFGRSGARSTPITVEATPGAVFAPQRSGWQVEGDHWRFVDCVFDHYEYGIIAGQTRLVEGLTIWGGAFRNASRAALQIHDTGGLTVDGTKFEQIRSSRPGVDTVAVQFLSDSYDAMLHAIHGRNIGSDTVHIMPHAPASMKTVSNLQIVNCLFETDTESSENGVDGKGDKTGPVFITNCTFRNFHIPPPDADCSGDAFGAGLFCQIGVHDVWVAGCRFENCETGIRVGPGSEFDGDTGPVHIIGCSFPGTRTEISRNEVRTIVYREDRDYHAPALRPVVIQAVPEFDREPVRSALGRARVQLIGVSEQLDEVEELLSSV